MFKFTLMDIQCFDAVVREGSFQAASAVLNKTHPTIFSSIAKLERQLGIKLLDRSGYRVQPTETGVAFHQKTQSLLNEAHQLDIYSHQLALGIEPVLKLVIGDLAPREQILASLSNFFAQQPATRLDLQFEAVNGPNEKLFDNEADFIIHHIDKTDTRLEWVDIGKVKLIPVVAQHFLPFEVTTSLSIDNMRDFTQCVIRDTASHSQESNHLLIEGANQCIVSDHQMKKEMITQGLAWGHLPDFVVKKELTSQKLVSLEGKNFKGVTEDLVIARRKDRPHGPVADLLWKHMQKQPPKPV